MNVLLSGGSGLAGGALRASLASEGHRVLTLVRGREARDETEVAWAPDAGRIDTSRLDGVDVVVNLAGATIARWPWSRAHKRRILESRVGATALLARATAALPRPPRCFVSASAVGFYGSRGDEVLREESPPGSGFLAEVCRAWESAAEPAAQAGMRVATLRTGLVLSATGGALPVLARPFRLGLGGPLGNGRQFMSWITLEDLVRAIAHILERADLSGPVNTVSPDPVTNAEFTKTLGRVLRRPTPFAVPAFGLRLFLGEMADELFLASQRVEPARLTASGFQFRHPTLESALRASLTSS
jgi:uncharacterized protein (TIGR01777 family)